MEQELDELSQATIAKVVAGSLNQLQRICSEMLDLQFEMAAIPIGSDLIPELAQARQDLDTAKQSCQIATRRVPTLLDLLRQPPS